MCQSQGKTSHLHFVFVCCIASQLPQEKTGGIELIVPVVHSRNAAGAVDELIVIINSLNEVCGLLQTTKYDNLLYARLLKLLLPGLD